MTPETPRLLERVARFASQEQLFRRTSSVLLALSGGADSTAALLLLRALRARFGFALSAAHFDHQLRPESRSDLERMRELCAQLDVPFLSGEGDVRGTAAKTQQGIEATARSMRYQFLAFVAAEKRIEAIATGHTADDQAETVLLRVLRGTGVRGLRGMIPSGPVPDAPAQRLIRPLLVVSHTETLQVCAEAQIVPLVDATNDDPAYLRNRVRGSTLPLLREINPSIEHALRGVAESAREAFAGIERRSYEVVAKERGSAGSIFPLAMLQGLPTEALTLVIEREAAFFKLDVDLNRTRLRNLRDVIQRGGGRVRFGEAVVESSAGLVRIGPVLEPAAFESRSVNIPGATAAGSWSLLVSLDPIEAAPGERVVRIDLGAVRGVLRFRPLEAGDRIRYHALVRKVSDLLSTAKVPTWDRQGAVALSDREGIVAIVTASRSFEADAPGDNPLWIRLSGRRAT